MHKYFLFSSCFPEKFQLQAQSQAEEKFGLNVEQRPGVLALKELSSRVAVIERLVQDFAGTIEKEKLLVPQAQVPTIYHRETL